MIVKVLRQVILCNDISLRKYELLCYVPLLSLQNAAGFNGFNSSKEKFLTSTIIERQKQAAITWQSIKKEKE